MKRKIFLSILISLFLIPAVLGANAFAYPVNVGDIISFSQGLRPDDPGQGGGEFDVYTAGHGDFLFTTFCAQRDESLNFRDDFLVADISDHVQLGNVPLVDQAAFLFWNYKQGTLDDIVAGWSYGDKTSIGSLQNALWKYELAGTSHESDYPINALQAVADAAVSSGWTNDGKVAIINLTTLQEEPAQDVFVAVPEPMTMVLLGFGLLGLGVCSRKKFFKKS